MMIMMLMMMSKKSANITAFYGANDNSGETSNAQCDPDDQAIYHLAHIFGTSS